MADEILYFYYNGQNIYVFIINLLSAISCGAAYNDNDVYASVISYIIYASPHCIYNYLMLRYYVIIVMACLKNQKEIEEQCNMAKYFAFAYLCLYYLDLICLLLDLHSMYIIANSFIILYSIICQTILSDNVRKIAIMQKMRYHRV